jgi:diguanylate cyclase (GGDEF)-like protein
MSHKTRRARARLCKSVRIARRVAATKCAARLRLRLAAHDWSGCHPDLRVTASFGVVEATGEATIEQLMQLADAALYRAKHNGRNRVESATR